MKKLFTILVLLAALNANGQWVPMNSGIQNNNNAITLAAVGNSIFAGTYNLIHNEGFVYRSTNNGINWLETNLYACVYAFTTLGGYYFAGTNGYGIYISADGLNWSQSGLLNKSVRSLATLENSIYAGTSDSGIFVSLNNGSSWSRTSLNNQSVYSLKTFGSNIFAGTVSNGVYLTTNNGTNWAQTALNNKTVISLAVSGNNIYASISDTGGIYKSINNGSSWTRAPLYNKYIESITAEGNNIFASTVYVGNSGGIYVSTNNGEYWFIKNEGFSYIPSSIYSLTISNNYVFVGTSRDTSVWRRPLSELVGIHNISREVPSVFSLNQNYPNPFNPATKIKFAIPKAGDAQVIVYDVMGREVQTLVNERLQPGTYEATFDGSALNSGVYFYKLTMDGFTETKKMLLIK